MALQRTLVLTQAQSDAIRHHAKQAYPEECCGVLVGVVGGAGPQCVTSVQALRNVWTEAVLAELEEFATAADDRRRTRGQRYWIDPADFLQVMRSARAQSWEIVGIYHSHPDHGAVASETDGLRSAGGHRQLAWPQYFYVIVSVMQGQFKDCRCWQLDETEQMRPVTLQVLP